LNIAELNDMIALGFAGKQWVCIWRWKRFDMVIVWINPIGVISMIWKIYMLQLLTGNRFRYRN
jgi:hypothetical protein